MIKGYADRSVILTTVKQCLEKGMNKYQAIIEVEKILNRTLPDEEKEFIYREVWM